MSDKMRSRYDSRDHKRKQNRLLNLLIAIVAVLIIIVGITEFTGNSSGGSSDQTSSKVDKGSQDDHATHSKEGKDNSDKSTDYSENKQDDKATSDDQDKKDTDKDKDKDKKDKDKDDDKDKDKKKDGGPDGPWKAVGTKQNGDHVSSYDKGSTDWNEKIEALRYATGIEGSYTLWDMRNDGGPQSSYGVISSKSNPSQKYEVHLKWIDGKGWKPTSVSKK